MTDRDKSINMLYTSIDQWNEETAEPWLKNEKLLEAIRGRMKPLDKPVTLHHSVNNIKPQNYPTGGLRSKS